MIECSELEPSHERTRVQKKQSGGSRWPQPWTGYVALRRLAMKYVSDKLESQLEAFREGSRWANR
jgi:hypothetical protein